MNPAKCLLLLLTALLAGCAVISEESCRAGLWYERGLQDGARGRGQSMVYEIAQQCREYGVRVDTEAWLRGYEEGVAHFCTPENGYYQGRRGNSYQGVCTGPGADLFMAQYRRGLADYQMEMEYLQLARRHHDLRRQLHAVNAALASAEEEAQIRALQLHRSALRRELNLLDIQLRRFGFY